MSGLFVFCSFGESPALEAESCELVHQKNHVLLYCFTGDLYGYTCNTQVHWLSQEYKHDQHDQQNIVFSYGV